jgi:NTP pyrophosphatase (non-canonical NTP hydrolase)
MTRVGDLAIRRASAGSLEVASRTADTLPAMEIEALQRTIANTYLERDRERGVDATFRWFTEEVGELARAIRTGERPELVHEFSDVLAWLASLANLLDVDLEAVAAAKYPATCQRCGTKPCTCDKG